MHALHAQGPITAQEEVLNALRNIIDPDFGQDIVTCGFIKKLAVDSATGKVALTIELTTPACPVKEVFKNQANEYVKVNRAPRGGIDSAGKLQGNEHNHLSPLCEGHSLGQGS
jgi:metal-sulfur cluster biosynthetic enzyme